MPRSKPIRVLIVEDHPIMRDGLKFCIQGESGLVVVGEAETGKQALRLARQEKPDIVLMDVQLPDTSGIDTTRSIRAKVPECEIIALTVHTDSRTIRAMLEAGAAGFLSKESYSDELVTAIRSVMKGGRYLGKDVGDTVYQHILDPEKAKKAGDPSPLTRRELEVLQATARGLSAKEAAAEFGVSQRTVEWHRYQIMSKLGIHSVAGLIQYAIRHRLVSLEE